MHVFVPRASFVLGLVACVAIAACTKSHDVTAVGAAVGGAGDGASAGAGDGSAGTGGGAGTGLGTGTGAGTGGGAGNGGGAGTGGSAGTGTSPECMNCEPADVFGMSVPACCTDEGICGLDVSSFGLGDAGCVERDAPGNLDTNCPTVMLMSFITAQGCCRSDGTCGIRDTFLGLGCTYNPNDQGIPCTPASGPE